MKKQHTFLILALCFLIPACVTVLNIDGFKDAKEKWGEINTGNYSYTYSRYCFCTEELIGPNTIVVEDNIVTRVIDPTTGTDRLTWDSLRALEKYPDLYMTIDGLFEEISTTKKEGAHSMRAEFDASTGMPTLIEIDHIKNATDDEVTHYSSDLVFD